MKAFRIFFKSFPDRKGTRGLGDFFHPGRFFGTPQSEQDAARISVSYLANEYVIH